MAEPRARRFRVAFSFAGEKRDYVEKLASVLAARFGQAAILYDKFHEAEFARYDLGIYLPKLYGEQSDLIIPVLCAHYDRKLWTGWEWLHIYSLLTKEDGARVMPCRFDHASADGLTKASAFIELDDKTPTDVATLILERLAVNEGRSKDFYTKSEVAEVPATMVANNLPRLQPFFGRTAELQVIRDALDPEARTWGALIDGPGGMGKTSLAIRAAYDFALELFRRVIFVSVKERELDDEGVRPLGTLLVPGFLGMLNEVGRELGESDLAKTPEQERVRLLLDRLRGSDALLILDNLESLTKKERDEVFNFVKRLPQGCKAILTSRRRIGSGSEELILEKLDEQAALATLADLAKRNPLLARTTTNQRIDLYNQTAGKPLLLRWVAGQLGRGSCRTLPDALAYLRSCPPDNDPLEFVFGDLANEFDTHEEKVLCALVYFSRPATTEHISVLADLTQQAAATALQGLANRSLVVPDHEEQHYTLVPLVAEFLRKHRPAVVIDTGNRVAARAFALIVENGWNHHDRFHILEASWPTIAPAFPLFLGGDNRLLQMICDALTDFLNFSGRWDEWLSLNEQAERRAVEAGANLHAGWRAFHIGFVHLLRKDATKLFECANRVHAYWSAETAGVHERALACRMVGDAHGLLGDHRRALAAHRQSVDLLRCSAPADRELAGALNSLGGPMLALGDFNGAQKCYREALRISRASGDRAGVAMYCGNLALVALAKHYWRRAEILARNALSLMEKVGRESSIAADCERLAEALLRQGKIPEALPYAERAVEIFSRLGSPAVKTAYETLQACRERQGS